MNRPYIISLSGESGVGKSTIANIASLFYGIDNTTILSTDDLHKWDRYNPIWKEITHLNPDANNLELGDIHLKQLASGDFIYRSHYNHKTGYFDPPIKIEPKKTVIIEGLHAFYTEIGKSLTDLKIFVDTNENLRIHWKIIRDTEERGYTYNTALEAINKRRIDAEKIKKSQIEDADVILTLRPEKEICRIGDKHEKVNLIIDITYQKNGVCPGLFNFIQSHINGFRDFINISEEIGNQINL